MTCVITHRVYCQTRRPQVKKSKMSGKKKLGAIWLNELTALADISTADGGKYPVYASVRGNLYVPRQPLLCVVTQQRDERRETRDERDDVGAAVHTQFANLCMLTLCPALNDAITTFTQGTN